MTKRWYISHGVRVTFARHDLLCDALRRFTRFAMVRGKTTDDITKAWTGLGCATVYTPATNAGLMECATKLNPGYCTWWRLTPLGAKIVAEWITQGFSYKNLPQWRDMTRRG